MSRVVSALRALRSLARRGTLWRSRWLPAGLAALVVAVALAGNALSSGPAERRPSPATPAPTARPDATPGSLSLPAYRPEDESTLALAEPDWPALLLDVGAKLLLTAGLAYASVYLLRRYVVRVGGSRRAARISVVETVPLGQHRALHLVRVGGKSILLGATSSQISLLAEVADPDGNAPTEPASRAAAGVGPTFAEHLRALLGVGGAGTSTPGERPGGVGQIEGCRQDERPSPADTPESRARCPRL